MLMGMRNLTHTFIISIETVALRASFRQEVAVWHKLDHPNVTKKKKENQREGERRFLRRPPHQQIRLRHRLLLLRMRRRRLMITVERVRSDVFPFHSVTIGGRTLSVWMSSKMKPFLHFWSLEFGGEPFYTFETWGEQLNDFCLDVVKDEAFFICNSIGELVGLQAAVSKPEICKGLMLINISLRMLHIKKQPLLGRPFIRSFQNLLRNTPVGKLFFKSIAKPETVRSILCQCYHDSSQVTDELVEAILRPGLEPGAVDVFLEFICYSGGPLPEDLLPQVKCPVLIAWGEKDPWEPIELGRMYSNFDAVEDFIALPEAGHCPQDEKPEMVNPLIESFVARHR